MKSDAKLNELSTSIYNLGFLKIVASLRLILDGFKVFFF